jgi:hypothetical protein
MIDYATAFALITQGLDTRINNALQSFVGVVAIPLAVMLSAYVATQIARYVINLLHR